MLIVEPVWELVLHQFKPRMHEANNPGSFGVCLVVLQPPPKLPSDHFSAEFCEFVNKWYVPSNNNNINIQKSNSLTQLKQQLQEQAWFSVPFTTATLEGFSWGKINIIIIIMIKYYYYYQYYYNDIEFLLYYNLG